MIDHLMSCNVCSFKEWNTQKGVICSKTKQKADFQSVCADYEYSAENYKNLILDKGKFYEKILSRDFVNSNDKLKVFPTKLKDRNNYLPDRLEIHFPFPIKLFYKKPLIIIDNKGIHWQKMAKGIFQIFTGKQIGMQTLKWNQIIYTSFQIEEINKGKDSERRTELFVVDAISNKSTIKLPVFWDINKLKVGHVVELFKMKNYVG